MSIQADIITALASVVSGRVYPNAVDEDIDPPFVVVRRSAYEPLMLLTGPEGTAKSTFLFECWGAKTPGIGAKGVALSTASSVKAALAAGFGSGTLGYFLEPVDGEQFDPATLEMMEPVLASFWHVDS